jgi:hypothetical protein
MEPMSKAQALHVPVVGITLSDVLAPEAGQRW